MRLVDIIARAEPHNGEAVAQFVLRQFFAARNVEKFFYGDALETYGLLKCDRKAEFRAFGNSFIFNFFVSEIYFTRSRLFDAHQQFDEGGFTAPVRARDDGNALFGKSQIYVFQNRLFFSRPLVLDGIAHIFEFDHKYSRRADSARVFLGNIIVFFCHGSVKSFSRHMKKTTVRRFFKCFYRF